MFSHRGVIRKDTYAKTFSARYPTTSVTTDRQAIHDATNFLCHAVEADKQDILALIRTAFGR